MKVTVARLNHNHRDYIIWKYEMNRFKHRDFKKNNNVFSGSAVYWYCLIGPHGQQKKLDLGSSLTAQTPAILSLGSLICSPPHCTVFLGSFNELHRELPSEHI